MKRTPEVALLIGVAGVAGFGVLLVNLASGGSLDAQVAVTFIVFAISFGGMHLAVRQWAPRATTYLLPLAGILAALGFVEVFRLDLERAGLQRWWILIASMVGVLLLGAINKRGLDPLRRYRTVFLAAALILLALPLLPEAGPLPLKGLEANGSRLWVVFELGFVVRFQPGELAKLALVLFLASYLAERRPALTGASRRLGPLELPEPRQLVPVAIAWAASFGVLVYQRDLGASLLLFSVFVSMLYVATGRTSYLTASGFLFSGGAVAAWAFFSHVQRRVTAWISPFSDFEGAGYQIAQGLFAMGSGSLSGSGLGLGRPNLIPNAETDFVFAAIGEELGLAGSIAVIAGFALLITIGFGISLQSRDLFRKLLAAGLATVLGVQTLLIIGGVVRMVPLTGITLPFMSYGGSSLVANFMILVLLLRISHEEQA